MQIKTENLFKIYSKGTINQVTAINDTSIEIQDGDFCIMTGPSGSGKTTLLSLLGLLTHPSKGKIYYGQDEVTAYSDSWQTKIRKEKVGFIFQQYNLLPQFSAWENVSLPNLCRKLAHKERKDQAVEIMTNLGLKNRIDFKVSHLSGGEQQRVAIARALVTNPEVIFADEPTASVDQATATAIINLFKSLKATGKTVIISTHDVSLIEEATLHLQIADGVVRTSQGDSKG